mgnify:CR=1 FL=1
MSSIRCVYNGPEFRNSVKRFVSLGKPWALARTADLGLMSFFSSSDISPRLCSVLIKDWIEDRRTKVGSFLILLNFVTSENSSSRAEIYMSRSITTNPFPLSGFNRTQSLRRLRTSSNWIMLLPIIMNLDLLMLSVKLVLQGFIYFRSLLI